jgi:hypothetical protein
MASKSQLVSALNMSRDQTGVLPALNAIIGEYGCLALVRWARGGVAVLDDLTYNTMFSSLSLGEVVRHWRIRIVRADPHGLAKFGIQRADGTENFLYSDGFSTDKSHSFKPFESDELIDITTDLNQKTMTVTAQGNQIVWYNVDARCFFFACLNSQTTIHICDVE